MMSPPKLKLLFSLLFIGLITEGQTELFTAMAQMEKIFQGEDYMGDLLLKYAESLEAKAESLKRLAAEFKNHSQMGLEDPVKVMGNPVSAYVLLKKLATDWQEKIKPSISSESASQDSEIVSEINRIHGTLPNEDDLSGAATALLRLQDTYHLSTNKLAKGEIPGVRQSLPMSAQDCYSVGLKAYQDNDFYHCVLWMQEALNRSQSDDDTSVPKNAAFSFKTNVLDYLSFSLYKQGNVKHAAFYTDMLLALDGAHERALSNKVYFDRMLMTEAIENEISIEDLKKKYVTSPPSLVPDHRDSYRRGEEFQRYEALCRGENLRPNKWRHRVYCRYVHHGNPLLFLRPLKEEVYYFLPRIVGYHDLLSDSEMNIVKEIGTPRLGRATVIDPITKEQKPAFYRVSQSGWLKDEDHPVVARVSRRIAAAGQLSLDTVEELQLQNYGLGGQYEPHFDHAKKSEEGSFEAWRGNRIATMLVYLSNVEAGGATAFIENRITVFPRKGTGVFWNNLMKSGEGDERTRHAGCPVLAGSKWAANKWFHLRGQEFHRRCGLKPTDRYTSHDFPQDYRLPTRPGYIPLNTID